MQPEWGKHLIFRFDSVTFLRVMSAETLSFPPPHL